MTQSPGSQFSWQVVQPFLKKTPPISSRNMPVCYQRSCCVLQQREVSRMILDEKQHRAHAHSFSPIARASARPAGPAINGLGEESEKRVKWSKTNNLSTSFPHLLLIFHHVAKSHMFQVFLPTRSPPEACIQWFNSIMSKSWDFSELPLMFQLLICIGKTECNITYTVELVTTKRWKMMIQFNIYIYIYIYTYTYTYLPTYLSIYLPIYLSTYLSIHLSTLHDIYNVPILSEFFHQPISLRRPHHGFWVGHLADFDHYSPVKGLGPM